MEKTVTIKSASSEDAFGIVSVRRETWISTYPNEKLGIKKKDIEDKLNQRTIEEEVKRTSERILNDTSKQTMVAKIIEIVIGFIVAIKGENENRIGALYILPKYQHQGIGKKLMERALQWLGSEKNIVFEVASYNLGAIKFYKKLGFVENGVGNNPTGKLPSGKEIPEIAMIKKF